MVEGLLLLLGIVVVVVVAVGWERLAFLGADGLRVYSHHGRLIRKPLLVLPSATPGQPPDFESRGLPLILIPKGLATDGREMLVCGPGCGLLQTKFDGQHQITLPPPIRATIRVPGEFRLPSGDHGIALRFSAAGVRPEIAAVVEGAAAPANHWDKPESPFWDEQIWLDPVMRSAAVLLPCTGTWSVTWGHLDRPPDGKFRSMGILYGTGEASLTVASDGEEHVLAIDPEVLDTVGSGLGGD